MGTIAALCSSCGLLLRVCATCLLSVVIPVTAADSDLKNSMRSRGGCICICSLYLASPIPLLHVTFEWYTHESRLGWRWFVVADYSCTFLVRSLLSSANM